MSDVVYRLFSKGGGLLYVGQSMRVATRLVEHSTRPFWPLVARIEIERQPDRATALVEEARAIHDEAPLFNILGRDPAELNHPIEHAMRGLLEFMAAFQEQLLSEEAFDSYVAALTDDERARLGHAFETAIAFCEAYMAAAA